MSKAAEAAEKERDSLAQRLANPNFTERAKPEAVEKARADHDAKAAEAERLRAALERLGRQTRHAELESASILEIRAESQNGP